MSGDQLLVRKIKEGTVIDHVEPGRALEVLKALGIKGDEGSTVTIAMNVPSTKLYRKDIVKIANRFLSADEADRIALIAPRASVNLVREYRVVEKRKVQLPNSFEGVFKCPNPTCITNTAEPVKPTLKVVGKDPPMLQCTYCLRLFQVDELL